MRKLKILTKTILIMALAVALSGGVNVINMENVYAASESEEVVGKIYEFGEKEEYDISKAKKVSSTEEKLTYGTLSVSGEINTVSDKNGIPAYGVEKGTISISYTYDDKMLKASEDKKHLVEDKSNKVNEIELKDDILNGAIILQTSKDGVHWYSIPEKTKTNVFKKDQKKNNAFYKTTDVQMVNGCYYRIIVAYKTGIRTTKGRIFPPRFEKVEYTKYAEVYEFYAYDESAINLNVPDKNKRRNLGTRVRTKSEGYVSEAKTDNDPHSGWDVGNFFVGGFTDYELDEEGNPIFLKNNDDRLSLWFELKQNLNKCHGNSAIKIVADPKGSDSYFEVPGGVNKTTNFGKGALIIRKINPDNTKEKPQIYTNYLEASTSIDAATKVNLFEEGDYEVALDYAVKFDKTKIFGKSILPETAKYKIFFKFSVRNGNSMAFLFDQGTGSELASGAFTENGFRLDLANSQYLKVNVKRDILRDGVDGVTEDTRFNSSASDGDVFTKEGIYTVTISNQYNDAITKKKIYVGTDNVLKAYMTMGMEISDIRKMIELGAVINEDGTVSEPDFITRDESVNTEKVKSLETQELKSNETAVAKVEENDVSDQNSNMPVLVISIIIGVIIVGIAAIIVFKKKQVTSRRGGRQ